MPFVDDFIGPNGQKIIDRPGWESTGSTNDNYVIADNGLATIGQWGSVFICPDQGAGDSYVFGRWPLDSDAASGLDYLLLYRDYNFYVLMGKSSSSPTGCIIGQVSSGSYQQLAAGRPPDSGPNLWLRAESEGNTIRMLSGGTGPTPGPWVEFLSATHSVGLLGTRSGFICQTDTGGVKINDYFQAGIVGDEGPGPSEPSSANATFFGQDF